MKTFLVIGLGRFGSAVACELCSLGNEVLAMDIREDRVQSLAPQVTHAVAADAKDPEVLKSLGVKTFDCAVVAVGNEIANSALITLNLKELGVEKVVCKAQNQTHRKVLEKIGADRVIIPEHEMGTKLAHALSNSNVLNFIELSEDASIVEVVVPAQWEGKTIRELDIRNTYGVTVIALRQSPNARFEVSPGADVALKKGCFVTVLGLDKNIDRVQKI